MMMMKNILLLGCLFCTFALSALDVVNAGIGGHTSKNGVERIDTLLRQENPQILVVSYGLNDICYEKVLVNLADFRANLIKMIETARKGGVREVVLCSVNDVLPESLLRRHQYSDQRDLNQMIGEYNAAVREVAEKENCLFVDFNRILQQHGGVSAASSSLIRNQANSKADDGIHLTPAGYMLLGESIAAILQDKVRKDDKILALGDSVTYGYGGMFPGEVSLRSQSYPAVLAGKLKAKFGEKLENPVEKSQNITFASDFAAAKVGALPTDFVLQQKDGDSLMVAEVNGGKGLKAVPGKSGSSLFLRTAVFAGAPGRYHLTIKGTGSGEILPRIQYYTPAAGTPAGNVNLTDGYVRIGDEMNFEFTVPAGTNKLCITFNVKAGEVVFSEITLIPAVMAPLGKNAVQKGQGVYSLGNAYIQVALADVRQGAGFVSIKNARQVEFINRNFNPSLWSLTLKKIKFDTTGMPGVVQLSIDPEQDDGGKGKNEDAASDLILTAADAVKLGATCRAEEKNGSLKLFWDNIAIGDEAGVLSVWAELKTNGDGRYIYIDGGFENRSKEYTCFYFALPQLGGLGAIGGKAEDDFVATPFFNGRLIRNPVEKGLFNSARIFQPNRSGHSMQFDLFYNSGSGLYFGSLDGEQYAKRHLIEASTTRGVDFALYNIPNNMRRVPQRWMVPYQSVLGCFDGDYYDGAQLYRQWALQQRWSSQGPILTRKSTPDWFKNIDEWQLMSIFNKNTPLFTEWVRDLDRDFGQYSIGVELCHWGAGHQFDGGSPDRFPLDQYDREQMGLLQQRNWPIMGYLQHTGWSSKSSSFLAGKESENNLVRNYYGQSLKWPDKKDASEELLIGYPGKMWKSILIETVCEMARNGFSAAYMDSGNHGGTYMNFTPACSDESGGGTSYIHENWKLLELLRSESRKIKDDFCFTSESFWEGNIAHLDGFLTVNTTNAYLEGDRVTAIPLAQIVYHDYTIMFALWPSNGDVARDHARGYIAKQGLAFVWGVKPGWNVYSLLYKRENSDVVLSSSQKRYAAYHAGKDYFVNGRLLRQPRVSGSGDQMSLSWNISWGDRYYDNIKMDRVLSGFFQNADGRSVVTLYNIDEVEHTVTVDLTNPEYKFGKRQPKLLYPEVLDYRYDADGMLQMTIPARSPVVIEFNI